MLYLRSDVHNAPAAVAFAETPDTLALFTWLHADVLIAKLDAEIDAEADDSAALSREERQRHEAEVMEDLLAVERDECALVWQAMEQGLPVEFRSDCSPQAVLGVQLVNRPHRDPPGTREHAFDKVMVGRRR